MATATAPEGIYGPGLTLLPRALVCLLSCAAGAVGPRSGPGNQNELVRRWSRVRAEERLGRDLTHAIVIVAPNSDADPLHQAPRAITAGYLTGRSLRRQPPYPLRRRAPWARRRYFSASLRACSSVSNGPWVTAGNLSTTH